jgi:membrane protein YdbS with pleckstrin-like domain
MNLSTGKLNFHLRQLAGLIEKQKEGEYRLTPIGRRSLDILNQIHSISEDEEQTVYFQTIKLGVILKEFQPGSEAKKANYIAISLFFLLFLWLPLVLTAGLVKFPFLGILVNHTSVVLRKFANAMTLTSIVLSILVLVLFFTKKYIESINYEILDTEIVIHKGIITKKRTVIPYRTITNLVVKRSPLDRLFGISKVVIQTAGESASSQPEGHMIGVYYPHDLLEEILNLVRLLDPPVYLKEKATISIKSAAIRELYVKILKKLENIDEKLSEE